MLNHSRTDCTVPKKMLDASYTTVTKRYSQGEVRSKMHIVQGVSPFHSGCIIKDDDNIKQIPLI